MTNEQIAAQDLKSKSDAIRISAFNAMAYMLTLSEKDRKNSGFKSNEEAVVFTLRTKLAEIDQLTKEFLKLYPD